MAAVALLPSIYADARYIDAVSSHLQGPADKPELLDLIEPFVYEYTAGLGGSISAEHGIGVMKPTKLHYSKSPEAIKMMQLMKKTLDPNRILNPYKTVLLD